MVALTKHRIIPFKLMLIFTASCLMYLQCLAQVQTDSLNHFSTQVDSISVLMDSSKTDSMSLASIKSDSLQSDSLLIKPDSTSSKDDLEDIITYSARDSVAFDLTDKKMFLYGKAKINYQDFELKAPDVEIGMESSILNAQSGYDSTQKEFDFPKFRDKGDKYDSEKMTYNFKTRRGKIADVKTTMDNAFFRGYKIKRMDDGIMYVENARYTTCSDTSHPHYWFLMGKAKVIPNDRVFARPITLYIQGVPVFILPFGFFPNKTGRSSGIIVPRYGRDETFGYFLKQGGYYWAINDFMDARLEGDWGTRGSWGTRSRFRYNKRYELSGELSGGFERTFENQSGDPDFLKNERWNINWIHNQEFNPTTRANINLSFVGGNSYSTSTFNTYQTLSQQATSSASLTKSLSEGQRSLTLSYQRTQDLRVKNISQNVSSNFYQARVFPFRKRQNIGNSPIERFGFDNTTFSIGLNTNATDTTGLQTWNGSLSSALVYQFSKESNFELRQGFSASGTLQHVEPAKDISGVQVTMPFSLNRTILKYFQVSGGATYTQFFVDRIAERVFNPSDSTITTKVIKGQSSFSTYSFNAGLNTQISGILYTGFLESLTNLKAIRHEIRPSVSYSFNPDFTSNQYGYYRTYNSSYKVNSTLRDTSYRYNKFEGALFSGIPTESQSVSISLQNIFSAKLKTLDTTKAIDDPDRNEKKVNQFLTVGLSTGFNFVAKEYNWSDLSLSANSSTIPNVTLSGGAVFDFYSYDLTGTRKPRALLADKGSLARFLSGNISASASFRGEKKQTVGRLNQVDSLQTALFQAQQQQNLQAGLPVADFRNFGQNVDFDIPWDLSFGLTMNAVRSNPYKDLELDAQINASGSISITPNWQIRGSATYLIKERKLAYPTISINRDLHCWQMSLNWTPIGVYRSYYFQINVKAPQLRDLKYEQRGDSYDIFNQ